jgi:methionyl aminopeptidase
VEEDIFSRYRKAGQITARALEIGKSRAREGYSLLALAEDIESYIRKEGAFPAFPVNLSVDDAAAHFTPSSDCELVLRRGQLVKIDCGACYGGCIGDSAITVEIGSNDQMALIESSRRALNRAIQAMKAGISAGEVGSVIEQEISSMGFAPVENLSGHEVAEYNLHAGISVPNIAERDSGIIREGMFLAVEPFSTPGRGYVVERENGNIYHFAGKKNVHNETARALMEDIASSRELSSLPFCERWCVRIEEKRGTDRKTTQKALKILERSGVVRNYPVLREVTGSVVSQWEHTLLIKNEGCEVMTSL